MKNYHLTLVVVMLASCWLQGSLAAVCDPRVINAIKQLWREKGVPSNILNQLIATKYSYFVATTAGVFQDEDDIICLKAITSDNSFMMEIGFNNGSSKVTDEYVVEDHGGDLYTPDEKQHRYHIPTPPDSRVQAFYTCTEDGKGKSGEPRGLIRVLGATSRPSTVVELVKRDFARVGIQVTKDFPLRCDAFREVS